MLNLLFVPILGFVSACKKNSQMVWHYPTKRPTSTTAYKTAWNVISRGADLSAPHDLQYARGHVLQHSAFFTHSPDSDRASIFFKAFNVVQEMAETIMAEAGEQSVPQQVDIKAALLRPAHSSTQTTEA